MAAIIKNSSVSPTYASSSVSSGFSSVHTTIDINEGKEGVLVGSVVKQVAPPILWNVPSEVGMTVLSKMEDPTLIRGFTKKVYYSILIFNDSDSIFSLATQESFKTKKADIAAQQEIISSSSCCPLISSSPCCLNRKRVVACMKDPTTHKVRNYATIFFVVLYIILSNIDTSGLALFSLPSLLLMSGKMISAGGSAVGPVLAWREKGKKDAAQQAFAEITLEIEQLIRKEKNRFGVLGEALIEDHVWSTPGYDNIGLLARLNAAGILSNEDLAARRATNLLMQKTLFEKWASSYQFIQKQMLAILRDQQDVDQVLLHLVDAIFLINAENARYLKTGRKCADSFFGNSMRGVLDRARDKQNREFDTRLNPPSRYAGIGLPSVLGTLIRSPDRKEKEDTEQSETLTSLPGATSPTATQSMEVSETPCIKTASEAGASKLAAFPSSPTETIQSPSSLTSTGSVSSKKSSTNRSSGSSGYTGRTLRSPSTIASARTSKKMIH